MKKLFLLISLVFLLSNLLAQKYSRILIPNGTAKIQTLAKLGLPIDDAFVKKNDLIIEINTYQLQKLNNYNIDYQILIDDVKKFYKKRLRQNTSINYPKGTPEHFHLGSMGGNLTYQELLDELNSMHSEYPNLITSKTPISTDTLTWENREIFYVNLTANANEPNNKPEVLFTGLHHAREPVSMMQLVYLMWWLLENYGIDQEATYFLDNFNIYFIPCVNPDGYVYNQTTDPDGGGMWRKNRRNNGNNTYGVDLNRNYTFNWGYDNDGSSPDPSSDTYRGPSPASEPETQLMIKFIEQHNFKLILNHHTYSNLLIYPYGYDEVYPEDYDVFKTYATIMTRVNHFAIGTPWELLYPVNGDANDWAYGQHQILAMTPETGNYQDGFWPSQDRIIPLCQNNMEMNKFLIRLTGKYAEAYDRNPVQIPIFGYNKIDISFLGQDTTGTFKIYLTGEKVLFSDTLTFTNYHLLQTITDSIFYLLDTNLTIGDSAIYYIAVDNGLITYKFPVRKKIIKIQKIFSDNCNNMNNWTSETWNITDEEFYSPNASITDSPNSNYQDNTNTTIVSNSIDLSNYDNIQLTFFAKWNIEDRYDYNYIKISTDGGNTWQDLATHYTENNGHGYAYTGYSDWVNDFADISNYASNNVKFKFNLSSDASINEDGFYFDDFNIISETSNTPPQITGQNTINTTQDEYTITPNDLLINDPDDNQFFVFAYNGENYQIKNFNTIVLPTGFEGTLQVPVKVHDGYNFSNFYTLTINASTNIEQNNTIKIYPIPANDIINITSLTNIKKIEIYDLIGKKVIEQTLNKTHTQINLSGLNSGIYILKLTDNKLVYTIKFSKK